MTGVVGAPNLQIRNASPHRAGPAMKDKLTKYEVRRLFHYNKVTGDFIWLRPSGYTNRVGSVANAKTKRGYVQVKIGREVHWVHRLIFLYMTGEYPKGVVDHVNGDASDNRWENLRDVTHQKNCKNQVVAKNNKSGVPGVSFHKSTQKWRAQIKVNGETIYLGLYETKDDAITARQEANKKYGFHDNHGKQKTSYTQNKRMKNILNERLQG